MWSIFLNGVMGITMLITFCFCIEDVQKFVNMVSDTCASTKTQYAEFSKSTDYPLIPVIYNATGSYAATCVLGTVLIVLLFFSTVTTVASSSRQIWSFSRDHVCSSAIVVTQVSRS